jgi:hypothetical protein
MFRKYQYYLIEIVIIIIISLLPLYWLRSGSVILGHDSMYVLDIPAQLRSIFYSWNIQKNFGSSWPLMHGFLPMYFTENFIFNLTSSFNLTQKFVFILWFIAIGLSMYILTVSVFPEKKFRYMRVISAVLYMLNFYNLELWFTADRPKFSLLTALPLGILIFYKLINRNISLLSGIVIFGLITVVFNQGALPPLLGTFWLVMLFAWFFFTLAKIREKSFIDLRHDLLILILLIFSMCLGNLYWLVSIITYSLGYYSTGVSSVGGIDGLINWEKMVSTNSSILNLLRLQGSPFWIQDNHQFASLFNTSPVLIISSFVFILVIIFGINLFLKLKTDRRKKGLILFFLSVFVVGLFFAGGTRPPFGIIYEMLMRHIPGFAIFRSSYYKFSPLVYVSVPFLFGYFISIMIDSFKNNKISRIFGVLFILFTIIYHFPFITSDPFKFTWGFSTRVKPPEYVYPISDYINKLPEDSRILLLPQLDSGYIGDPVDAYIWGYYSLESFPQIITHKTLIVKDMQSEDIIRVLYDSFRNGDFLTFNQLAKRIGITHILWRGDVKLSEVSEKNYSLKAWEEQLNRYPNLNLEKASVIWKLFRLNIKKDPVLSDTETISIAKVQPDLIGELIKYGNQNINSSYVLNQNIIPDFLKPFSESTIITPICRMCKPNEFKIFVESIKIAPYKTRYSMLLRLLRKNKADIPVSESGSPDNVIDNYLSDSNRILAEYSDKSENKFSRYLNDINRIRFYLDRLTGQSKNQYQIRVLGFLKVQLNYVNNLLINDVNQKNNLNKQLNIDIGNISNEVWMSDEKNNIYRYDFTLDNDNIFDIQPQEILSNFIIKIDNQEIAESELSGISLKSGYHQLSLEKNTNYSGDSIPDILIIHKTENQVLDRPKIEFQNINPSLYKIKIIGISKPMILKFNEKFDYNWDLKGISHRNHFEIDGYANGWLIDKTGNIELDLYYSPQKLLDIALLISSCYLFFMISALGYQILRFKKL